MGESMLKEDPLSRIQREIIEVTEREREFKEGHFRINRLLSESTIDVNQQNGHLNGDDKPQKTLNRAVSTSHLLGPISPNPPTTPTLLNTNGYTRRFTPQTGTKGLMQRFIANKGKLPATSPVAATPPTSFGVPLTHTPVPVITPMVTAPVITRTPEGKPMRKGYVPVEEKIQKELQEMKDREHELKRMRKKKKPFDLELSSDQETTSESDDEDIPLPGKLKATKSIGELYEALNEELRSPSPRNSSGQESIGSLKPAKSLAELCELAPGQEFLAPSSTRLIAQWESIIQQKHEAGAA